MLLAVAFVGCAASKNRPVAISAFMPDWIYTLTDGETERGSLVRRLGAPASTYDSERVVVYRLDAKYETVAAWEDTAFNIVLVFDANGVLARHGLVRVR